MGSWNHASILVEVIILKIKLN